MPTEEHKVDGQNLLARVKEIVHEGNVRRIIIKNEAGTRTARDPAHDRGGGRGADAGVGRDRRDRGPHRTLHARGREGSSAGVTGGLLPADSRIVPPPAAEHDRRPPQQLEIEPHEGDEHSECRVPLHLLWADPERRSIMSKFNSRFMAATITTAELKRIPGNPKPNTPGICMWKKLSTMVSR